MLQHIKSLLAITQLTTLHLAQQTATQQMFAQASYNQNAALGGSYQPYTQMNPNDPSMLQAGRYMGNANFHGVNEMNNTQLIKELLPFISLPSVTATQGRQLGLDDTNKVNWTEVEQYLLDQAFPEAVGIEKIDLTDSVLVITSRYSPISYTLGGISHIHWDSEIGNQLPFTFTVIPVNEPKA